MVGGGAVVQLDPSPCLRSETPSSASRFPPHSWLSRGSWLLQGTPGVWPPISKSPAQPAPGHHHSLLGDPSHLPRPPCIQPRQVSRCKCAPVRSLSKPSRDPWWPLRDSPLQGPGSGGPGLPSSSCPAPPPPLPPAACTSEEAAFCLASRLSRTLSPAGNLDQARDSSPVERLPEPSPVLSSSHSWSR